MGRNIYKRIYFTLIIALAVSGFIVICTLGRTVRYARIESKLEAAALEEPEPLYIVREHNGKIALFCRGNPEPFRYLEFDISLLPDFDREQLREGYGLYTDEELRTYIQDVEG